MIEGDRISELEIHCQYWRRGYQSRSQYQFTCIDAQNFEQPVYEEDVVECAATGHDKIDCFDVVAKVSLEGEGRVKVFP